MESKLILCACADVEHQLILSSFEDEQLIFLHYHLPKRGLMNRIKVAVRHVFGFQSRYGAFGEMVLDVNSADEIIKYLNDFKKRLPEPPEK